MKSRTRFGEHSTVVNRRPVIIPGRRFAVVAVVAAAWLASIGASAASASSTPTAQATIYTAGFKIAESPVTLSTCSSSYSGPYTIEEHGSNGTLLQSQAIPQAEVWSIADVIGCFTSPPIPLAAVTQITIKASDGFPESGLGAPLAGPASAGQDDLVAPSGFFRSEEVPLVFNSGEVLTYIRPWRGGTDDNEFDTTNPSESQLQLDVYEGPVIPNVAITASPSTIQAGGSVSFTAAVPGNHPNLSYTWGFDGGAGDSAAASPNVTFDTPGTYQVTLEVIDPTTGSPGEAPPVIVTVTGDTPPTQTTPTSQTTPTGPAGSNGLVPQQGPGVSPSKNPGRAGHHPGRSAARAGRHTSKRAATRPPTAAAPGSGSGSGSGASSGSAASGIFSGTPVHGPNPGRATNAHSLRVDGRLISDVRLLPASASPLVHALPSGGTAPVLRRRSGPSPLPALAAALGVVVLFGLGAGREMRWRVAARSLRSGI